MTSQPLTTSRALVLSGAGRFQDPWHPFPATSGRLADLLREDGLQVEVTDDVAAALQHLDGVDLLVCNFALPKEGGPDDEAAHQGLLAYLARGGAVLGLHVVAGTLLGIPEWETVVRGAWVPGVTMHPPLGEAQILVHPDQHAIVAPLHDFTLLDERYTNLRVAPDVVGLAAHRHEDREHPLLWARQVGNARVVYDALGHDARSYDSPEHQRIVRRSARWLLGALD